MAIVYPANSRSLLADRARALLVICFTALGACLLRLAYLQLVRGRALSQASESNHTQILVERAPRGRILDRNGIVLADDQPVFVALFSPLGLHTPDFHIVIERLAPILKLSTNEMEHRMRSAVRSKSMMRISDRLTREQAFMILQDRIHLPGVSLTIEEQRYYPKGISSAHVLGYVGQITEEELDRFSDVGYQQGDWIGKTGLERVYDPLLHGQDGGFLIEIDALGRQLRVIRHVLPKAGRDLVLTLDYRLQELAAEKISETGHPGSAVVMNPYTGEVLAMVSSPAFDPNVFMPLGDPSQRGALLSDPELPLYNRAIQAIYPPGSVFKIVASIAGLEEEVIHPTELVHCDGSYTLGKERRIFHCWNIKGHGWVDFQTALSQSCDVYYYEQSMRMGPSVIERYAKMFHLGARTGVDLLSEKSGLLPIKWKADHKSHWQGGDTLNYAIGQGALQVTVMQIAALLAAVGTRGDFYQPYIAAESRRFGEPNETLGSARLVDHVQISDGVWQRVQDGLVEVVRSGTGGAARMTTTVVAGKTGTAQASKGGDHAWFAAYAPAEHPTVSVAVMVEHGGHGGAIAAPIAHDLMVMALHAPAVERTLHGEGHGD